MWIRFESESIKNQKFTENKAFNNNNLVKTLLYYADMIMQLLLLVYY